MVCSTTLSLALISQARVCTVKDFGPAIRSLAVAPDVSGPEVLTLLRGVQGVTGASPEYDS